MNDLAADAELYVFDGCIAAQRWQDGDPIDLGIIVSFPDDPVGLLHEIATAAGWTQRSDAYYGTAYRRPDAGVVRVCRHRDRDPARDVGRARWTTLEEWRLPAAVQGVLNQ